MNQPTSKTNAIICGRRMTFLQMIDDYRIVIPVIQRDYAQGRENEKVTEVRKNFVKSLISDIKDQSGQFHDLDFIYGTVNQTASTIDEFIPLDGQQRLTTLFLLYLYVAGRNGHYEDFTARMKASDGTFKFSYKTRNSSTMFCERLLQEYSITEFDETCNKTVTKNINIFDLLKKKEKCFVQAGVQSGKPRVSYISEIIKNQGWFYLSWLNDPTVAGMLVMLDEINSQFINDPEKNLLSIAYNRLFNDDQTAPPITFQMLPLNGYSRTDDLYIKLNARGLHLSDFENFKARIEELMKNDKLAKINDFMQKIDIDWNEYLWPHRGKADNTDGILENLFRNFIAFAYRDVKYDKKTMGEKMAYLLEQNDKSMRFTFSRYCELGVFHERKEAVDQTRINLEKNMIEKIISFFDIFCNEITTPENATCKWLDAKRFIHDRFIDKTIPFYSNRLRLYAYLQYHNTHGTSIDPDDLNQWMRFVRNLDEATDIDAPENFYQAITSIDNLLDAIGHKKVQEWLSTDGRYYTISFFRQREMKEECIKAELIAQEKKFGLDTIKNAVYEGDMNSYLTGQMGFVFEFAGVYPLYENDKIKSLSRVDLYHIGLTVSGYTQKSIALFNILSSDSPGVLATDRLLERALLSLGMYLRENSAKRWNFCNMMKDPYNSWKTLLFVEKENAQGRNIFKDMLGQISVSSIQTDLEKIISNSKKKKLPIWRRLIIDNKALIDYCSQGFLYIEDKDKINDDEADVILLNQSQMNHYHSELFTRDLFEKLRNIFQIGYRPERKYEIDSTIYIKFKKNGSDKIYELRLWHWDGDWDHKIIDEDNNNVSIPITLTNQKDGEQILKDVFTFLKLNNYEIVVNT